MTTDKVTIGVTDENGKLLESLTEKGLFADQMDAAKLALSLAVRKLIADGKLTVNPLLHPVAAVSVGIVEKLALLDLCYTEDAAAEVDLNLVMNAEGQIIEVQGSGEEATFSETQLAEMMGLGKAGIRELLKLQQQAIMGT